MQKKKAARLAGFVGALCASGALVGLTVSSTGAYFTDSHDGNLSASSGHLRVDVSGSSLNYSGLIPGQDQSKTIGFTPTAGSANEDIWMVFDTNSAAYGQFTGTNHKDYSGYSDGGLGGYGHFKVVGGQGYSFESYNLQVAADPSTGCTIDANGDGGSAARATGPDNASQSAPECGVPGAILLAHDLPAGYNGSATVTFGLTGKAKGQDTTYANVPFKIVATQVGIRPDAANY